MPQGVSHTVATAADATRWLALYGQVLRSGPVVQSLHHLVRAMADRQAPDRDRLWELADTLMRALWEGTTPAAAAWTASQPERDPPWLADIVDAILTDDNPFTRACARAGRPAEVPPSLRRAAAEDLRRLQKLAHITPPELEQALADRGLPWPANLLAGPERGVLASPATRPRADLVSRLHRAFARSSDWGELVEELMAYHQAAGAGPFARYVAFRWEHRPRPGSAEPAGELFGIPYPDPIRLEHLVGYEAERARVVTNTERFVRGLPAHHLLLYGPRGTGKSATVKALVHAFGDRGLRLVELPRAYLPDLPEVVRRLREQPLRFVLLVDDLSFEEGEAVQRELKAALEGTVEAWPPNVVVYATSNRRHLVQEPAAQDGLARPQDEVNERISLADRFAVTVIFPAADQELYLRIVEELAARAGVDLDRQTLRQRALRWAMWHNERSPRTARQFVEELRGELGLLQQGAGPGEHGSSHPGQGPPGEAPPGRLHGTASRHR